MKFKTNRFSLNFILFSMLLTTSRITSLLAVTSDTDKPIHIESDVQSIDVKRNTITFTGNVIVTRGTTKINADRVVIIRQDNEKSKEFIDSYGNPTTFYQIQDNGKPIKGRASKMHYELAKDFLVLTGNACLEQPDSSITSDKITYLVKEQKIQAYSEKGKRVTAILIPSKLQKDNQTTT